ncbi:beta strand repeat-containing protein [Microcoleus sp. FACHB-672]|uniref:beta strand repeat-containing protein n=1 Tax=Microcoleus sp. FACHB-672 TaxID=2692825 RepID=UPI0018F02C64|nr:calcium-binding protein [Microcoleus sp. FACHB-672]
MTRQRCNLAQAGCSAIADLMGKDTSFTPLKIQQESPKKEEKIMALNDNFINSFGLYGSNGTTIGDNINATKETGEPNHAGFTGGTSVWWSWTAPVDRAATIDTFGSNFDTLLGVYTGSSVSGLTTIASNDDTNGLQSQVTFNPVAGTTYQVAVDGFSATQGNIVLNYQIEAPTNDNFIDSSVLIASPTAAAITATGDNFGATQEAGEPNHGGYTEGQSVWWSWTAPLTRQTTINTFGSNFDTLLGVHTGSSVSGLTTIAAIDDSNGGTQSQVTFNAVAGTTYQIAVDGYSTNEGNISLTLDQADQPANDNFVNSAVLSGTDNRRLTATGDNINATKEAGEPNHAGFTGGESAWWTWTATGNGETTINTFGSSFDTMLGVYTGSSVSALTTIAGNDDTNAGTQSQVTFNAVAGTTYRIAVDGFNPSEGNISLALNQTLGTAGNDSLVGSASNSVIEGLAGNDTILGNAGNDSLNGGDGNDSVDGGIGIDSLVGGLGNDTYGVDSASDIIIEAAAAGTDSVNASVTHTLAANVENLTLTGSALINGTGNTLNNVINGNSANNSLSGSVGNDSLNGNSGNDTVNGGDGNDSLNGGIGIDSLIGGLGNDIYVVDSASDIVTEAASAGTDIVNSSVTHTLAANVENLTLTGSALINGTGNILNNVINGNSANNSLNGSAGNDSLSGGAGNDSLTGGSGSDQFIYNTNAAFTAASVGVDILTDFAGAAAGDKILLDRTTFTAISSAAGTGFSLASEFARVGSDAAAATSTADIVYNSANGNLFYNQNGSAAGFGTGALFATLSGAPALAGTDFMIQI